MATKCDGCGLSGSVPSTFSYRSGEEHRDYKLSHRCCAKRPEIVDDHQQFPGKTFRFYIKHPAGSNGRSCAVCDKTVPGFVYHCSENGADLHPCCALTRDCKCRCHNPNAEGGNSSCSKNKKPVGLIRGKW